MALHPIGIPSHSAPGQFLPGVRFDSGSERYLEFSLWPTEAAAVAAAETILSSATIREPVPGVAVVPDRQMEESKG